MTASQKVRVIFWLSVVILLVGWVFYLIAFNPALMSPDSVAQWRQAQRLAIRDSHPAIHTLLIVLLQRIYPSPTVVAIAQMLVMALVMAGWLKFLYQRGLKGWLTLVMAGVLAILPSNGFLVVTLWKDVLYTAAVAGLSLTILRLMTLSRREPVGWRLVGCLVVSLAATRLLRHNGTLPYWLTMLGLGIWSSKYFSRRVVGAMVASVVLVWFIRGPVYRWVRVDMGQAQSVSFPILHGLGAVIARGGKLPKDVRKFALEVMPEREWRRFYSPYTINLYAFGEASAYGVQDIYGRLSYPELLSQYGRAFLESPAIIVRDKLQMSDLAWNLVTPAGGEVYRWPNNDGDVALVQARQVNGLTRLWRWADANSGPLAEILLWRVGGWTIVLAVMGWYWWQRGKKWWLLALLPVWGNLWSMWLAMPAQDYRYVWCVLVATMFLPLVNLTDEVQIDDDGGEFAKNHHPS